MASDTLSKQVIKYIEGIRKEKSLSVSEFVKHFEITEQAYYAWLRSIRKGAEPIRPRIENVERGLASLGYTAYFLVTKPDRE